MKYTTALLTFAVMMFFANACASAREGLSDTQVEQIHQLVENKFPASGAGAAVLVLKNNKVIYEQAFGQAVIEFQVPMRTNSLLNLGSITKQFTAVAILMLQEAGKLSLEDNIAQYIPEYQQAHSNIITIKHLLTHTAGIPNYDGKNGYTHHGTEKDSFEMILSAFNVVPLEFKPGSNVNYSNSGYILLGRIIEKISKLSYQEFIATRIFDKLGMKDSQFYDYYSVVPGLAKGYEIEEQAPYNIVHGKAVKPSLLGDGGIVSTLSDLTKWYKALDTNTLISSQNLALAHSAYILEDGRNTKVGLGWKVANLGPFKTVEHGGNNHGFENYILQLPEKQLVVMVFTNLNRSYPGSLAEKIAAVVTGLPIAEKQKIALSTEQLDRYTGKYQYADGDVRSIQREGDILVSVRNGGQKLQLIPFDNNKFYFADAPVYWLRFEQDKVTGVNTMYSESRVNPYIKAKQVL